MKIYKLILPFFACMLFACDSNDDGFYNTKYIVSNDDLAFIEAQPDYNVGDVLYVDAAIPNLIQAVGEPNLLNIRETTGNATNFVFNYYLERNTGGDNWEYVDMTNNFVPDQGIGHGGMSIEAFAVYNPAGDAYIYRGGIHLMQAGNYRLSFGYNSLNVNEVAFISNSAEQNIALNISSSVDLINGGGYFVFTVAP